MNRYLLNCEQGNFLIVLEGEPEDYFIIDRNCSYKIVPYRVKRQKNKIFFITVDFMDATRVSEFV